MLVILLGAPGAGKGTQAEEIVDRYRLTHISTGDILRASIKKGTELGKKAKDYLDKGELVPDEVVVEIVKERLKEPDSQSGALLDGFPRTIEQARQLSGVLEELGRKIDGVIYIDVDEEELISRLSGRRICRECGSTYHLKFNAPKVRNVCDQCGGELYQREDDSVETVKQRINVFREQTEPLIDFYQDKGLLYSVDGNKDIEQVFSRVKEILDNKQGN